MSNQDNNVHVDTVFSDAFTTTSAVSNFIARIRESYYKLNGMLLQVTEERDKLRKEIEGLKGSNKKK